MKKLLSVMSIILITGNMTIPLNAQPVTVPQGTSVIVKLTELVSSATHKKGDTISLVVVNNVLLDGKTVIAAGAPVKGTVESAAKRFIAGIGGQIEISVNEVKAVDGTFVPLKFSKETHNGSTVMAAIVAVVCCCCAWLIPGKDVSIDKDTLFDATTLSAASVNVTAIK